MTTTPFIETVETSWRIALTAAASAPFLSPRPTQRPAAIAAASVTRTSSRARLRSGCSAPTRSEPGTPATDMLGSYPQRKFVAQSMTECPRAGAPMTAATVGGRGAGRAQATRASLLAAAREVFSGSGFAEANIADVVSRAGASVGSLYHHFGGKADLYLALFEDYQMRQEERAAAAVRGARGEGERDPFELFLVGAGAYLRGCWEERELARMFLDGGGPPGFELIARRRYRDWILVNAALLRAADQPLGETLVLVLPTVVAGAGREVAVQDTYDDAMRLADEVVEMLGRIGRG